jgi:hypothetical protein
MTRRFYQNLGSAAYNRLMIKNVEYQGITDCLEISNGDARMVISTGFGPRILFYGYDDGENILGWHPQAAVETAIGTWKPYGGHRLWVAPENMPLSYDPDSVPVEHESIGELSALFRSLAGSGYPVDKEITVSLSNIGTAATIEHRLTNSGDSELEIAAWALTIMRPGGTVIAPNEPLAGYNADNLLPVRTIAVWPYTDFTDRRWKFEKDSINLSVDENSKGPQKFGVLNKQGWAAYEWNRLKFTKRTDYTEEAIYPDMNSNFEFYTDGGFVEIETLSPLKTVSPGESLEHCESWELNKIKG